MITRTRKIKLNCNICKFRSITKIFSPLIDHLADTMPICFCCPSCACLEAAAAAAVAVAPTAAAVSALNVSVIDTLARLLQDADALFFKWLCKSET